MFAEYVEKVDNMVIGQQPPSYQLVVIALAAIACIIWVRFIFKTIKTNRDVEQMQTKFEEQQKKTDELKRELEELKKPTP